MTLLAAGLTVTFSQAMFLHYSYEPIEEEPTRGRRLKDWQSRFVEEDKEMKEEEEQNESTFATKMMLSRTKRTTTTTKEEE